jgi:hypothetical protein
MQEDSCILFFALQDTGDWRSKAWSNSGTSVAGHGSGTLPQATDPDMLARCPEGGEGNQGHRRPPSLP